MTILKDLLQKKLNKDKNFTFLIKDNKQLKLSEILERKKDSFKEILPGDIVAVIGDYDKVTIKNLIYLIDKKTIIVPLTRETKQDHKFFFEVAQVDFVLEGDILINLKNKDKKKPLFKKIRGKTAGLILFSSGSTGKPKAILHKIPNFLKRFKIKKNKNFKTISFLLFDHIGGIHTLFYTLFNGGTLIVPNNRNVDHILRLSKKFSVDVLPATPTFLKILLMTKNIEKIMPKSIKIITYATEIMNKSTLEILCKKFKKIDFRQKYGMSEMGILRVISKSKDSNYFKIVDKNVKTKIINNILYIKSKYRMLGYLNAKNPIKKDGWYKTNDIVEKENGFIKITGRKDKVINIGGLKVLPHFVEEKILLFKDVLHCKVYGEKNPITGQHVEAIIEPRNFKKFNKTKFYKFIEKNVQNFMQPKRIRFDKINISHRQKKI